MIDMRRDNRLVVLVVLVVVAGLAAATASGCGGSSSGGKGDAEPATVEPVKGTDISRVTLTQDAARRLGIRTVSVRPQGGRMKVVPYGAVVYGADGGTFTYVSPKPLQYVRAPISVDRIDGPRAILSVGPPVGTAVVTVGSQELYGSEYEVEGE
jgi:hypothetical protein